MKAKRCFRIFVLAVFLISITYERSHCQVSNQGPFNGSMFNEEFGPCLSCPGSSWSVTQNAMLPDSVYTSCQLSVYPTCFMTSCYYGRAILASDFGFSLPPAAIIKGIKADVLRMASNGNAIHDSLVMLLKGGIRCGGNRAQPAIPFPAGATYLSYGDSTDLWDTVWTALEINAPDFGLYFKPLNKSVNVAFAEVDHIQVTVFYSDPTGIPVQTATAINMKYDRQINSLLISNSFHQGMGKLSLYDSKGSLEMEKNLNIPVSNITVPLNRLSNGIYVAVLSTENKNTIFKFSTR